MTTNFNLSQKLDAVHQDGDASCSYATSEKSPRPLGPRESFTEGGRVQRTPVKPAQKVLDQTMAGRSHQTVS